MPADRPAKIMKPRDKFVPISVVQIEANGSCKEKKNKGFPNEPDVGYRNFFIPRVEKTSKN